MQFFDTHIHLSMCVKEHEMDSFIVEARRDGVSGMLDLGIDPDMCRKAIAHAGKYDFVYAGVGIHPHDVKSYNIVDTMKILGKMSEHPKVVAIGETGLDFYRNLSPADKQKEFFIEHIRLAKALDLPVIVHDREAHDDVMKIIDREKPEKLILHCYAGDKKMAAWAVERGYYMGFGGSATFKKSTRPEILESIPIESVLLETDAPFLAPVPFRGKPNKPGYLKFVVEKMAQIWQMDVKTICDKTFSNTQEILNIVEV